MSQLVTTLSPDSGYINPSVFALLSSAVLALLPTPETQLRLQSSLSKEIQSKMSALTQTATLIATDNLLGFPATQHDLREIIHHLEAVEPITVNVTSLDYTLNFYSRDVDIVSADHVQLSMPKTDDFVVEWIKMGMRLDYFYTEWSTYHPNTSMWLNLFEACGIPAGRYVRSPLQDPTYVEIESLRELELYMKTFREEIATITASYLFLRQVIRKKNLPVPYQTVFTPPYVMEPTYDVEFRGYVPLRIKVKRGLPCYSLDAAKERRYRSIRTMYAKAVAHTPGPMAEEFLNKANLHEKKEYQYETDRIWQEVMKKATPPPPMEVGVSTMYEFGSQENPVRLDLAEETTEDESLEDDSPDESYEDAWEAVPQKYEDIAGW
jgi:hypothetical protein